MKSSQILRKAKRRIESGSGISTFLCYAIMGVVIDAAPEIRRKAEALRVRVMASIYPHASAAEWLHRCIKPKQRYDVWVDINESALREWRVRWLDALIKEYEAKGD